MPRFLFDTDHVSYFIHSHPKVLRRYLSTPFGDVGVCPVSIEETFRGRLAVLNRRLTGPQRVQGYANLAEALDSLSTLPSVPFDPASEVEFQRLLGMRIRVGTQDLKVAAVALAYGRVVLTCNRRDFARIPGVTLDDWTV